MRVWFNRTFSTVHAAISLIRQADVVGNYHIVYTHTSPDTPASRIAHQCGVEPKSTTGEKYVEWCLAFCLKNDIGIFVPGKEASAISGARARFAAQGTRVLCAATQEVLHLLHDKARFCKTVDLPHAAPAAFRVFENVEQFDAAYDELARDFETLCIKPSVSVYGLGFAVLDKERNAAQLLLDGAAYKVGLEDFRRGLAQMESCRPMLLMEYLSGAEYSVDCVGDNGRLICAVPRKKAVVANQGQTIVMDPVVLDATAKLAAAYQLNGNFNVQFREDNDQPRLLEINPRMSGGIGMACLAGPNLPYLALRGFDGGFDGLDVPAVHEGMRVNEMSHPVVAL
jgi:hypothetical protein